MVSNEASDLLSGYAEIGLHLHLSARQAKHLAETGGLPHFRLPGTRIVRARRSSLDAWLAATEAAAKRPAA